MPEQYKIYTRAIGVTLPAVHLAGSCENEYFMDMHKLSSSSQAPRCQQPLLAQRAIPRPCPPLCRDRHGANLNLSVPDKMTPRAQTSPSAIARSGGQATHWCMPIKYYVASVTGQE